MNFSILYSHSFKFATDDEGKKSYQKVEENFLYTLIK